MDNFNELYSYHIFMFPFQWKYIGKDYENVGLDEKSDLTFFVNSIHNNPNWKKNKFSIDSRLKYNEVNYFYDFVRDILYDTSSTDNNLNKINNNFFAHFEYNIKPDEHHYNIHLADKTYSLLIDSIMLNVYNTGIGVLSFHLNNRNPYQKEPDDILRINQYGRRLYPPFFGLPMDIIGTSQQYKPFGFAEGLALSKNIEIPEGISISPYVNDGYQEYAAKTNFDEGLFILPRFISFLFSELPISTKKNYVITDKTEIFIEPVLDDRMFVICWFGHANANKIKDDYLNAINNNKNLKIEDNSSLDFLYKFIFVDGIKYRTCQNDSETLEFIKSNTNTRWINYGTIYGVTRYSFVLLTGTLNELKNNNAAFLVNHIQTMYYKMVELCLLQRACILKFSDEVTELSGLIRGSEKELAGKVSSLYKQYIRFVNKIYFREVTAQLQGIELYDMLQEQMKLKEQVKDLDNEISELHNYVALEEQRNENKVINRLTMLSAFFLPASLVAAVFGMNTFKLDNGVFDTISFWFWWSVLGMALSTTIVMVYFHIQKKRNSKRKKL